MAGDCGLNALSLLPENEQVQYLQKIALRAENPSGPKVFHGKTNIRTSYIFCEAIFCCHWGSTFSGRWHGY